MHSDLVKVDPLHPLPENDCLVLKMDGYCSAVEGGSKFPARETDGLSNAVTDHPVRLMAMWSRAIRLLTFPG